MHTSNSIGIPINMTTTIMLLYRHKKILGYVWPSKYLRENVRKIKYKEKKK